MHRGCGARARGWAGVGDPQQLNIDDQLAISIYGLLSAQLSIEDLQQPLQGFLSTGLLPQEPGRGAVQLGHTYRTVRKLPRSTPSL